MLHQKPLHKPSGWKHKPQPPGNRIPEEDRLDIFREQEQPIPLEDIEAERVYRASIKMHGRRAFRSLRSEDNESGAASGRPASRSFGKGNNLAQVEGVGQRRGGGGVAFRNRRGTDEGGALRGDREGQTHLRSREGRGLGRREGRREGRYRKQEQEDEMDETGDAEFERLDNLYDKMMLSEFEQLQEALISGPREQVYERLNQRKFEQNILEPTATIARELSNSQDTAVTASLLGMPSSTAPVRASPAARRALLARQQGQREKQGEYKRWLPPKVQSLGCTDFAKLSGTAPVIGLQYLLAKKPEIGLNYRQANDAKIVTFLKKVAPESTATRINSTKSQQQPAVSPRRTFLSLYTSLISLTGSPELGSHRTCFNTLF